MARTCLAGPLPVRASSYHDKLCACPTSPTSSHPGTEGAAHEHVDLYRQFWALIGTRFMRR